MSSELKLQQLVKLFRENLERCNAVILNDLAQSRMALEGVKADWDALYARRKNRKNHADTLR